MSAEMCRRGLPKALTERFDIRTRNTLSEGAAVLDTPGSRGAILGETGVSGVNRSGVREGPGSVADGCPANRRRAPQAAGLGKDQRVAGFEGVDTRAPCTNPRG